MQTLTVTFLGLFEFIGTTELLVVLFFALLVFGPRKLPELGRSLGQALNQVRAASDEFKQTWEAEALLAAEAERQRPPRARAIAARKSGGESAAEDSAPRAGEEAEAGTLSHALEPQHAEANG